MSKADYKLANYCGGKWLSTGKKHLPVVDKYTGELLAEVPLATEAQVEAAIAGAVQYLREGPALSAAKRSQMIQRLADELRASENEMAELIVAEAGKPIDYARAEIQRCITTLEASAQEALRIGGEVVPMDYGAGEGKMAFTKRFPIGVVAAISPFNFPLNLALHKIGPALAAGCPILLKPAPQSPLSALAFAKMAERAELPPYALQIFAADIPEAEKLVRDERIALLSFTGSPQIGWHLKNICGKKKVTLELGGNAAAIVDETADLDKAIPSLVTGSFLYAGQICISTQRIFVAQAIWDTFIDRFVAATQEVRTGNPRETGVVVGPVIDTGHLERIDAWVLEAQAKGAKLLVGGKILDRKRGLYAPTVLTGVSEDAKVSCEEVFGPVVVVEPVATFEEALARVNRSKFGLQAGVFSARMDRIKHAFQALEVGGVIANGIPGFRVDTMPYGGIKDSGLGREGIRYAIEDMTEMKLLVF